MFDDLFVVQGNVTVEYMFDALVCIAMFAKNQHMICQHTCAPQSFQCFVNVTLQVYPMHNVSQAFAFFLGKTCLLVMLIAWSARPEIESGKGALGCPTAGLDGT